MSLEYLKCKYTTIVTGHKTRLDWFIAAIYTYCITPLHLYKSHTNWLTSSLLRPCVHTAMWYHLLRLQESELKPVQVRVQVHLSWYDHCQNTLGC